MLLVVVSGFADDASRVLAQRHLEHLRWLVEHGRLKGDDEVSDDR